MRRWGRDREKLTVARNDLAVEGGLVAVLDEELVLAARREALGCEG